MCAAFVGETESLWLCGRVVGTACARRGCGGVWGGRVWGVPVLPLRCHTLRFNLHLNLRTMIAMRILAFFAASAAAFAPVQHSAFVVAPMQQRSAIASVRVAVTPVAQFGRKADPAAAKAALAKKQADVRSWSRAVHLPSRLPQ